MKVCPVCEFENPDSRLKCLRCEAVLELTLEQEQEARMIREKLTKNVITDEEEEQALIDSWIEAMKHRFDWIWVIGDRIKRIKYMGATLALLALIFGVLIGLSVIFSSMGL